MTGNRAVSDGRKILAESRTPSRMGTRTCKCLSISGAEADATNAYQTIRTSGHRRTMFPNTVPQRDPVNETTGCARHPYSQAPERSAEILQLQLYVPSNCVFRQLPVRFGNTPFPDSVRFLRRLSSLPVSRCPSGARK